MISFDADKIMNVLSNPTSYTEGIPNSRIIYRMLWALYQRQTNDERNMEATVHHNNVGFNGVDAKFLSSVAQNGKPWGDLTGKQAQAVAKCLKKYLIQLIEIANEKQPVKAAIPKRGKKKNEAQAELFRNADKDWIEQKNRFAEEEKKQEQLAFESDPDFQAFIKGKKTIDAL